MPQMNPMNWLLLLLFFNGILYLTMVKLHYLFKEVVMVSESSAAVDEAPKLNLKI